MTRITGLRVTDVRFPTSVALDGSDAMNPDPDYSAAYAVLETDREGLEGHGLAFTIGRGNEVVCTAIRSLAPRVVGLELAWIQEDPARFWRHVTGDSQLRWIGPDKGALHLATAAVVNAAWDLWARETGKPLWQLLADMEPEELVRAVDFRYLTDVLTPEDALSLLRARRAGRRRAGATFWRTATPATPRRPAGSATTTTRSAVSAARRSIRGSTTSSSRWAGTLPMTSAVWRSRARRSARTAS